MLVGFARYSQDRSFAVLGRNRSFLLVMAAGSVVGTFVGGQLLGIVPGRLLIPALAAILVAVGVQGLAASLTGRRATGGARGLVQRPMPSSRSHGRTSLSPEPRLNPTEPAATSRIRAPLTQTISTTDALAAYCARAKDATYVTVDTEFLRERTYYAQLCLVQMALPGTDDADAVLIDPLADGLSLDPLYELFRADGVVKVFHAARQDLEIFHVEGGVVPAPLFRHAGGRHGLRLRRAGGLRDAGAPDRQCAARQVPRASPTGRGGRCPDAQKTYAWPM